MIACFGTLAVTFPLLESVFCYYYHSSKFLNHGVTGVTGLTGLTVQKKEEEEEGVVD